LALGRAFEHAGPDMATALHSMELRQRIAADAAIIVASLRRAFDFSISFEINIGNVD
jgi:hypothetical protein